MRRIVHELLVILNFKLPWKWKEISPNFLGLNIYKCLFAKLDNSTLKQWKEDEKETTHRFLALGNRFKASAVLLMTKSSSKLKLFTITNNIRHEEPSEPNPIGILTVLLFIVVGQLVIGDCGFLDLLFLHGEFTELWVTGRTNTTSTNTKLCHYISTNHAPFTIAFHIKRGVLFASCKLCWWV